MTKGILQQEGVDSTLPELLGWLARHSIPLVVLAWKDKAGKKFRDRVAATETKLPKCRIWRIAKEEEVIQSGWSTWIPHVLDYWEHGWDTASRQYCPDGTPCEGGVCPEPEPHETGRRERLQ